MDDRFKFRVWHKKRKRMYEVLHLHTETLTNGGEWATAKGFNIITQQNIHIQIEPKDGVIMQCTGLKDKNGKLIYEGDIVKIFHVSGTMQGKYFFDVVEWNDLRCRFDTENYGIINDDDVYEVIGNIYENKELLESKEK